MKGSHFPPSKVRTFSSAGFCIFLGTATLALSFMRAESVEAAAPRTTVLESLELRGTERVDAIDLAEELGIKPGDELNDEFVTSARSRILSLGLFRSCFLAVKKGSAPGKGKLIITVEDDGSVLGPWAMGGTLAMTYGEAKAASSGLGGSPLGYRFGLVARNIARSMHRGSLAADVDGLGMIRGAQLAYGFPRFTAEGVQFDAEVSAIDPSRRYLDTLGYGGRGQALWNRNISQNGLIRYGVGMYLNQTRYRFKMPGYPEQVAGPKVGYVYEERLMRFFPGAGTHADASFLLATRNQKNSTGEASLAHTFNFSDTLYFTLEGRGIVSGAKSRGFRGETRFDMPIGEPEGDNKVSDAGVFLRLRGGSDIADGNIYQGSAAIFGLRYHSEGFIAEVAVQITRTPEELAGKEIDRRTSTDKSAYREASGERR